MFKKNITSRGTRHCLVNFQHRLMQSPGLLQSPACCKVQAHCNIQTQANHKRLGCTDPGATPWGIGVSSPKTESNSPWVGLHLPAEFHLIQPRDHAWGSSPWTWTCCRTSGWGLRPDLTQPVPHFQGCSSTFVLGNFPRNAPFGLYGSQDPVFRAPCPCQLGVLNEMYPITSQG